MTVDTSSVFGACAGTSLQITEEEDVMTFNGGDLVDVPMTNELVDVELSANSRVDLQQSDVSIQPGGCCSIARSKIQEIVAHIGFRIVIMSLILIDLIFVIVDVSVEDVNTRWIFDIISVVFSCIFVVELILRIISRGLKRFFVTDIVNIVDSSVILITFTTSIVVLAINNGELATIKFVLLGRLIRLPRLIMLIRIVYTERKLFAKASRHLVSENKQRFKNAGFDLDLCYITDRVIATSFPSTGFQAMYRNPISDVARFLDTFHRDHYKIYNMCSERSYDPSYFHGRVGRVFIDDHNPPLLEDMLEFAKSARSWMNEDPKNVLVVHCKGGKGRTGTMICTHLIDNGTFTTAQEVLGHFGMKRTDFTEGKKFQGVETPSQSRYVGYFEKLKNELNFEIPPERVIRLTSLEMHGMSSVGAGDGSDFYIEVFEGKSQVYTVDLGDLLKQNDSRKEDGTSGDSYQNPVSAPLHFDIPDFPEVKRDVKMKFYCRTKSVPATYEKCAFFFWFHTAFLEGTSLSLDRTELDNPHKQKTWKLYKTDFRIVVNFV